MVAALAPRVEPGDRLHATEHDTTWLVLPEGDTASVEFLDRFVRLESPAPGVKMDGARLRIGPARPGRRDLGIGSFVGRRSHLVRIEVVASRSLDLLLQPVGVRPTSWTDSATLAMLNLEIARLFLGTGIHPRLWLASPVRIPPSPAFWDPEGDGHLDLMRNDDSLRPSPALDSLVRWLEARNLVFPRVVLFQAPVRVGWALETAVKAGDSLLLLANQTTLPWRDRRGSVIHYLLASPTGCRLDTFEVMGYVGNTQKIRTTGNGGKWRHPHDPRTDIVLRPDLDSPAFGLSPSWHLGAAPLILLPDARKLADALQAARVIAHEICHTLGLHHHDNSSNLMSPVLRMDIPNPVLTPQQVLKLRESPLLPPAR